jgi:hypothetical protein
MPRDLTALERSEAELDAATELTPDVLDEARAWAREHMGPEMAELLDAELEPQQPTA